MRLQLTIKRFHSVAAAHIDFNNPTFFVGCNGSGKSNLADAFSFISEIATIPLQGAFDKRGGIHTVATRVPQTFATFAERTRRGRHETLGLAISFIKDGGDQTDVFRSARYAFEVRPLSRFEFEVEREQALVQTETKVHYFDRKGAKVDSNVEWMRAVANWGNTTALLLPLVGTTVPFYYVADLLKRMCVYAIEPAKLRGPQDPETGAVLRVDGSNATSVLSELKRRNPYTVNRLEELLASVTPSIRGVRVVRQGKQYALKFSQGWGPDKRLDFDAFSMSDGTLRTLGLLLALHQLPSPSVAVIEEPEATIHPGALGTILDVLRSASKSMQVVVTTHSPDVLDAKWIGAENIRIVNWDRGVTQISEIGDVPRQALRSHLMGAGELFRTNALEPTELFEEPTASQLSLFESIES
jgi:predicted ATPase